MKKEKMILVVGALLAGSVFAIDTRTWTDASGDHLWNNANNWDPNTTANSYNVFPGGRDWEVIIDGSNEKYYISLELTEGAGTVTLKGANSAELKSAENAFIKIAEGRELNVNGIVFNLCTNSCSENAFINGTLRLSSGSVKTGGRSLGGGVYDWHVIGGDAKIVVDGGTFGGAASYVCLTNNATITVNGGLFVHSAGYFSSPDAPRESITRVRLLGGTYQNTHNYTYTTHFLDGAHLAVNGGRLLWGRTDGLLYNCLNSEIDTYSPGQYFADCLPQFGGEVVIPTCTTNVDVKARFYGAVKFFYSNNRDYDFGGTIYATNNCNNAGVKDVAAGNIYFQGEDGGSLSIRGGATIYANAFRVNSNKTFTNNLDLTSLNLGIGGICRYQNAGSPYQYINFLDGIEFGAWGGNVARSGAYATRMYVSLEGPVAYDTQDCFEPATSRNIEMDCLKMDDMTELKAVGGGIVSLYPSSMGVNELRTVEVGDGTTLAFCTNVAVKLKTMNLKLGENAKLKINMKNGDYVDASATAEFGAGAKIVVTDVPPTLTAGMFYPVYFAPAGTDPDLANVEYEGSDWPTGWYFAKRGSAVYLTDGNEPVYSDPNNKYSWSGGGSDNVYTNLDNWGGKEGHLCNVNGGADVYFNGRKNTDIYNDYPYFLQRRWLFGADAGPFLFGGNYIRFQNPTNITLNLNKTTPSIMNNSKFPIAISNRLAAYSCALWTAARQQGSISLMGLGSMMNASTTVYVPLLVAGDIRIGGAYTSEYVRVAANTTESSVQRTTRLTIMPGGLLKTLNQSGDFNEKGAGALAVANGGTIDIAGTELLLTSNSTHYVDGAMTVACPLVLQGRQAFRGDGTLTLSGGVSGEGIVRVEGGLTLVPGAWGSGVTLSVKDNVTIAPTADWTFGGAGLDLAHHSALTFATGGHKVTLGRAASSVSSTMTVSGGGQLVLAEAGTRLDRLSLEDSSTIAVSARLTTNSGWVKALAVRDNSVPIMFSGEIGNINQREYVDETGYTVYCIKGEKGMMLLVR